MNGTIVSIEPVSGGYRISSDAGGPVYFTTDPASAQAIAEAM